MLGPSQEQRLSFRFAVQHLDLLELQVGRVSSSHFVAEKNSAEDVNRRKKSYVGQDLKKYHFSTSYLTPYFWMREISVQICVQTLASREKVH